MTIDSPESTAEKPDRRRWHPVAIVVAVMAFAIGVFLNVPGEPIIVPNILDFGPYPPDFSCWWQYMAHGWPFHFLTHVEPPTITSHFVSPWSFGDTPEIDVWKLGANVAVILSGSLLLGWLAHRHNAKYGYRFTLGNLAALVLVIGCLLGYGTYRYRLHQAQLAAVASSGTEVKFLEWQEFGPYWLRLLTGNTYWSWGDLLVSIDPAHSDDIDNFPGKSSILVIRPAEIDFTDLPVLADFPHLKGLDFTMVNFKGEAAYNESGDLVLTPLMQRIAACPALEGINLYDVDLTDADLKVLNTLPGLKHLNVSHNPRITDAGLAHLASMSSLRLLDLFGTKVTDEGVERLQTQLPNCEIEWDGMEQESWLSP